MYTLDDGSIFIECPEDFDKAKLNFGQCFGIKCIKCGNVQTRKFKGTEIANYKTMKCGKCLRSEHISATYENNSQRPEARQKMREYWANKSPEEKERWRQQSVNFWKNASDEEIKEYVLRNKASKLRNHGDEKYCNAEKISETKRNWSDEQLQHMLDQLHTTNLERNGDPYYNNSKQMSETKKNWTDEQKQQMLDNLHNTNIELHGDPYYNNSSQAKETTLSRYNAYNTRYVYDYYGVHLDSTWELAVWIFCTDHGMNIIRHPKSLKYYDCNGKEHKYLVDFMINGYLVEVKGDMFWNPDGTMCCPYTKNKVDGVWISATPEEKIYLDDLSERKHQCGLANGVEFWRGLDCKLYIDYCNSRYPGWSERFRKDNPLNPSYWCFSFVNPGHMQPMYYAPVITPSVSPFDKPGIDGFVVKGHGVSPYDIPRQ